MTDDLTEELEEAATNLDVLPRGVTQPLAAAKDMIEQFEGPTLDAGFDFFKKIQNVRRRIMSAREMERLNSVPENPSKRQNTRPSGSTSRRNSARNLQEEFQAPDLSFLQNLASRSDGFNTSSSSGHCKYQIFKGSSSLLIKFLQLKNQVQLLCHLKLVFETHHLFKASMLE